MTSSYDPKRLVVHRLRVRALPEDWVWLELHARDTGTRLEDSVRTALHEFATDIRWQYAQAGNPTGKVLEANPDDLPFDLGPSGFLDVPTVTQLITAAQEGRILDWGTSGNLLDHFGLPHHP